MAFLNEQALRGIGFKRLGCNVRISDKASIYDPEKIEIADNVRIDDFCVISGRVNFGRNVHVAVFCNVAGGDVGIIFEDFSGLAYGCQVFTQSDDYTGRSLTNPTVPDKYKIETKKAVVIGRHAIVGTSSIILPGVVLGEGTAVGAMSLVNHSTESWSVYFGCPAKRLKARKRDLLKLEAEYVSGI
ncbi:acyltransferase [Sphaerotilus hippei]|uniref:acyltransferase n=1 Tax=Sphaerotilus hippei TaxID=744406 RepID=UPI000D7628F7|nr:acyltransferase [Sphaerotilus hippei]